MTTTQWQLEASGLQEDGQFTGLRYDAELDGICLLKRVLVEDDATAIGKPQGATERSWFEVLEAGLRIRKELVLDDAVAEGAQLLFCGVEPEDNEDPLYVSVNGIEIVRPPTKYAHPQCKHYYTSDWAPSHFDNWFVIELPVGALQKGVNTIELWADSAEPSWQVMVAADSELTRGSDPPRQPVARSARSVDGGGSWLRQGLGQKQAIDGEYCVRLHLDRYVAQGKFRSAAIDVTGADAGELHRALQVQNCSASWQASGGGSIDVRVRFAGTPLVDGQGWSAWESVDGLQGEWSSPAGRWLQFEAILSSADPLASPLLLGVLLEAQVETQADALGQPTPSPRLTELRNRNVTRSSVNYCWEDPAALRQMRERFELDSIVEGAATEFEAQLRLMHWAYRIPLGQLGPYAWSYEDLPQLERDDGGAIHLLGPYEQPRREGHCLFCNFTLIAALLSFGYPARWVNMSTKHTYGHEVTEVWSNDFDKWIFLDATRDFYMVDPDTAVPLSLAEIGARVAEILPAPVTWNCPIPGQLPGGVSPDNVRVAYRRPNHGGPVFVEGAAHDLLMIGHLQMPLRNDFATRPTPVPWRISSNWGSSEFYCWSSPMFPPKLEYANGTERLQDWEPPLNRVQLTLCETGEPGQLRVHADTVTPWWEAFELCVDGGDWETQQEPTWPWILHEGRNHLVVRVRNKEGIGGPESSAVVTWTA